MKSILRNLAVGVPLLVATGCGERWDGFVYPNKGDLTVHIVAIQGAKSLEECRMAATSHPSFNRERGDYECGLNCKFNKGIQINICDKTER